MAAPAVAVTPVAELACLEELSNAAGGVELKGVNCEPKS